MRQAVGRRRRKAHRRSQFRRDIRVPLALQAINEAACFTTASEPDSIVARSLIASCPANAKVSSIRANGKARDPSRDVDHVWPWMSGEPPTAARAAEACTRTCDVAHFLPCRCVCPCFLPTTPFPRDVLIAPRPCRASSAASPSARPSTSVPPPGPLLHIDRNRPTGSDANLFAR